jgi:putative membrane protein
MSPDPPQVGSFDPRSITRPAPVLMKYYFVTSLLTVLGLPFTLTLLWFRYLTLRYRFDDEGVWMGVGMLFKRETNLAYRRIQDIHVTRGIIQRWFGLATVSVQTASGSATAEMTIEGVLEAEQLRDFLYAKMRGARGLDAGASHPIADGAAHAGTPALPGSAPADEALVLLREIRDALRDRPAAGGGPP